MANEYNYDAAIKVILDAFTVGTNVTYEQLEVAMGLKSPITSATPANNCALSKLKRRLKEEHGLVMKSANVKGGENNYYVISKVKDNVISKKESNSDKDSNYEALSKNNQKLYMELENAKAANAALQEKYIALQEKELEYITIIQSLMALAGIA